MGRFLHGQHVLRRLYLTALLVLVVVMALVWQQIQSSQVNLSSTEAEESSDPVEEPIQPLPSIDYASLRKITLGKTLFQDARLSGDKKVSCLSCHNLQTGGADRKSYSVGVNKAIGTVNTPTILNVIHNFRYNWNGRYEDLKEHTNALIQNPEVMGSQWPDVVQKLKKIPEYRQAFAKLYDDGVTSINIIDAIVAYESILNTPNSRFDQYLRGDQAALSAAEQEGYQLFKTYGCISCHQGTNVGGNMFQKFGVIGNYFSDRGNITKADFGRFNVTQVEADRFVFRVPSLRNVAVTPPYFHDGSAETLEKAIAIMVKYQLGRPIPAAHITLIKQFLETLTGEYESVPSETEAP